MVATREGRERRWLLTMGSLEVCPRLLTDGSMPRPPAQMTPPGLLVVRGNALQSRRDVSRCARPWG